MIDTLFVRFVRTLALPALAAAGALLVVTGCETQPSGPPPWVTNHDQPSTAAAAASTNSLVLHPGDNIKVSFPGAPNMDAQTAIRLDGKINLPMIGELTAAGVTPKELEQDLLRVAGPQLVLKEVNVTVLSSAFDVYVSGAVLRPGKITSDRVLTPLQALMEAGVDYQKANLKAVEIVRKDDSGQSHNFKLNLKEVLKGEKSDSFTLKPYDIIYVPERFNWF
ncbi:MAG TPA: polysaccharide biosynthesis/export family protein [Verrucomicrobiae bacterium]|jgi:polysaccharide export outer membrane protein|nr:polysaccharide biosynthesis/export family protein [Verrucomicrobiae bacterium]